jgi:signal peptidase II
VKKLVKLLPYFWVSLLVIIIDLISKHLIRNSLESGQIIKLTPKLIWLTLVQNTGAAFSFSFGNPLLNRILFIIISLIAIVFIIYLSTKSKNKLEVFSIGNLIDRIFMGSVTDFIWCDFPDLIMTRWPIFNLADSSIVVAVVLMIISTFYYKRTNEERE